MTTERLVIQRSVLAEMQTVYNIEHDPAVSPYLFKQTLEEHTAELLNPNVLTFTIREKKTDDIAGYLICDYNRHSEWLELRRMAFCKRNMGYGRETLTEILRYGFEELGVNKVWLEAYPDNAPGTHLYDSMGFHRDGLRRQHSKEERGFLDEIQYSMLKSEYKLLKR